MKLNIKDFSDKESLEAFVYAAKVVRALRNRDISLIDEYQNTYDCGKGVIVVDGTSSHVTLDGTTLVGCTHEETGEIYARVDDVKEFFVDLKVISNLTVWDII